MGPMPGRHRLSGVCDFSSFQSPLMLSLSKHPRCHHPTNLLATASPRNTKNPIESVIIVTNTELATAGS